MSAMAAGAASCGITLTCVTAVLTAAEAEVAGTAPTNRDATAPKTTRASGHYRRVGDANGRTVSQGTNVTPCCLAG